jgi:uncharacterized protein (UPF0335 family)
MQIGNIPSDVLKQYIERIERLEEEKAEVASNIREIFAEAKADGFDAKVMRQVIRARKLKPQERDEEETMLIIYKRALGMLPELDEVEEDAA